MRSMLVVALGLAGCDVVFSLDGPQCVGNTCLVDAAPDEPGATELAVDADELFWITPGAIRACTIADCAPRDVATGQVGAHGLLVDGAHVLFAVDNEMRWIARDGTGLVKQWHDDSGSRVEDFVRLDDHIWWTSQTNGLTRCDYNPNNGNCTSSSTGQNTDMIGGAIATDVTGHLWATTSDEVVQIDASDATIQKSFSLPAAKFLATSSSHVFSVADNSTQVVAWLLTAPATTAPTPIVDTPVPQGFVVTATDFYVVDGGGAILRLPLTELDSPVETVASELPALRAIAIGGGRVFVISGDRIASFPEP